jgi:hypothetical protein
MTMQCPFPSTALGGHMARRLQVFVDFGKFAPLGIASKETLK